jgi:hypothetical protein
MTNPGPDPTVNELIARWRERRRQILDALPTTLRAEFYRLGAAIKSIKSMFGERNTKIRVVHTPVSGRIPMSEHKKKAVDYLRQVESATRLEILANTGVPEGSLSQLLRDKEFEQVERGRWRLAKRGASR